MERVILLQKDANVVHVSGKQLGSHLQAGLHPEISVITDIVIQGGGPVNKADRVVPIEQVAFRRV